jgi:Sigma-70, region 4
VLSPGRKMSPEEAAAQLREGLLTGQWAAREELLGRHLDGLHTWFHLNGLSGESAAAATLDAVSAVLREPPPELSPDLWLLRSFLQHAPLALNRQRRIRADFSPLAERWRCLPADLQPVLWLREICGSKTADIADILQIPASTVRIRLQRARQELAGNPP